MGAQSSNDPILARFLAALEAMYGDEIDRVVLFGSRARGDANAESDYDVAIFLKRLDDRLAERQRLADLRVKLIDELGILFDLLPYLADPTLIARH